MDHPGTPSDTKYLPGNHRRRYALLILRVSIPLMDNFQQLVFTSFLVLANHSINSRFFFSFFPFLSNRSNVSLNTLEISLLKSRIIVVRIGHLSFTIITFFEEISIFI